MKYKSVLLAVVSGLTAIGIFAFHSFEVPKETLWRTLRKIPLNDSCKADGSLSGDGAVNCVDLDGYRYVHGAVSKVFKVGEGVKPPLFLFNISPVSSDSNPNAEFQTFRARVLEHVSKL